MKLADRFETLGRARSPDLWPDIEGREPRPLSVEMPRRHRALTAAVAFAVATAAIGLTVRAFLGTGERSSVTTPAPIVPKANGAIWFRVGGGDAPSFIYEINPDGTGQRLVFGSESDPLRYSQIAWSPDGSRIAYIDPIVGKRGVYVSDPDGVDPPQLTYGVNDGWPAWSPDGTRVAFSSTRYDPNIEACRPAGDFLCPTDIYVMDANGSNVKRLTYDPVPEYHPVWSPDGTKIAFVQTFNGTATAIYAMNSDGTDVRQVSSHDGGSDFSPSWSPDGSRIVFSSIRFEDWRIFVVNPDGTDEHSILDSGGFVDQSVWSPDGKLIAFVGSGFGDFPDGHALYVMQLDGSDVRRVSSQDLEYGVAGDIAWQPLPAPSESVEPSPSRQVGAEARVTHTIDVAPFPNAVAVGEGGVWVSAPRDDGSGSGDVVRIDPATGEIVARIPIQSLPGWEFGGGGMAVGQGSVWVLGNVGGGRDCCTAIVQQIDPRTNQVVAVIEFGPGIVGDVWVDDTGIWVVYLTPEGTGLEVAHADLSTHDLIARFPVPGEWSQTIFGAAGSIWVTALMPGDDGSFGGPGSQSYMDRIDPVKHAVERIICHNCEGAFSGAGAPWVRVEGGVQKFDPSTGKLAGDLIEISRNCCTRPFVGDGVGGVWVANDRRLWHVNSDGVIDASGEIPGDEEAEAWTGVAYAFDPETQTIWVVHYRDSVSRIQVSVT